MCKNKFSSNYFGMEKFSSVSNKQLVKHLENISEAVCKSILLKDIRTYMTYWEDIFWMKGRLNIEMSVLPK